MPFISATRLRLKSVYYLLPFMMVNEGAVKELKKNKGFLGGFELVDKGLTFWTLTMWDADTDMKGFRNSASHRKAMQKLPVFCDEASYVHWLQDENKFPDWKTVYEKMMSEEGKTTKVKFPSPAQLTKSYPPIKWTRTQRELKPIK